MKAAAIVGWCVVALLAGCASRGESTVDASASSLSVPRVSRDAAATAPSRGSVLGRHERVLVYMPQAGDTWAGIAARFLGDAAQGWRVAGANRGAAAAAGTTAAGTAAHSTAAHSTAATSTAGSSPATVGVTPGPQPGMPVAVPLVAPNPLGVGPGDVQRVTILCYHRIGAAGTRMTITPQRFEAQLDWLVGDGWAVVSLDDVAAFMAGRRALPSKSVAITFDDGYQSVWRHAFPALRKRGMPSTLFVYTDFVGGGDALTWAQMDAMRRSGLVEIQAHSKSHRNLADRAPGESDAAYRAWLDTELSAPRAAIERALPGAKVRHFAYPYGDASEAVLDAMRRHGYELGLTVVPAPVAFYASPLVLGRVMIYGDLDLDDFKARLQSRRMPGRS